MSPPAFLLLPSGPELWVVAGLIILLFGASKLPELARSMGLAQKEFHKAKREAEAELSEPAAKATTGSDESERERLERAARDLGIEPEGKSVAELKAAIKAAME